MILAISGSRYQRNEQTGSETQFIPDICLLDLNLSKLLEKLLLVNKNGTTFKGFNLKYFTELNHGGAKGFDVTFVKYIDTHYPEIKINRLRPQYLKGNTEEILKHNKIAPILRNKDIVSNADFLIAVSSHKNSNGTQSTINFAKELNIPFVHLLCTNGSKYNVLEMKIEI